MLLLLLRSFSARHSLLLLGPRSARMLLLCRAANVLLVLRFSCRGRRQLAAWRWCWRRTAILGAGRRSAGLQLRQIGCKAALGLRLHRVEKPISPGAGPWSNPLAFWPSLANSRTAES